MDYPYKLVNNFLHDKEDVNIMECSGINSTEVDHIQKILDSYVFWQIVELAKGIRFGLVIRDNSTRKTLEDTIEQFTNIFKDNNLLTPNVKEKLQNFISFIVTFATECKNDDEIENKINTIKIELTSLYNSLDDENQKFIISQLSNSIHLFKKASLTEPFSEKLNLENLVYNNKLVNNSGNLTDNDKWSTLKEIYIKSYLYQPTEVILPKVLSDLINENISVIGEIIIKFFQINKNFITNPFFAFYKLDLRQELTSEIFSKHYDLLKDYLPNPILSEAITPIQKASKNFFPMLKEIKEFVDSYNNNKNNSFKMAWEFLEIIRKFYSIKGNIDIKNKVIFQEKLGEYIYF